MTPTKYMQQKDRSLQLHNESEYSGIDGNNYFSFNSGGVECEIGEFLFAMVRVLKPEYVLETGTHEGIGASYMALGCKENGFGEVHTIEFLPENHLKSKNRFKKLALDKYVVSSLMDVADYEPEFEYGMILLDTEPQTRFAELLQFYKSLKPGGYLFIHDLHRHMHQIDNQEHGFAWPYGRIPEAMNTLIINGSLRPFHFPTPRGMTGFYKTTEQDYQWT